MEEDPETRKEIREAVGRGIGEMAKSVYGCKDVSAEEMVNLINSDAHENAIVTDHDEVVKLFDIMAKMSKEEKKEGKE